MHGHFIHRSSGDSNSLAQGSASKRSRTHLRRNIATLGEFLAPRSNGDTVQGPEFIRNLRESFLNLKPVPVSHRGEKKMFIFKVLHTAEKVFVRRGIPKKSSQPTYYILRKYGPREM